MNEDFGCAVIVLNRNFEILAGKRKNNFRADMYGLPGGRSGVQEKLIDCAKRELFEETGLKASELEYLGVVREWQDSYTFIHFIYVCREWKGKLLLKEPDKCEGWKWFDLEDLPTELLPGHRQGIEMLKSNDLIRDV